MYGLTIINDASFFKVHFLMSVHIFMQHYKICQCLFMLIVHKFYFSIGVVLGFLSNDKLSSAIKSYTGTINNAITDTVNYVNGTVSVSNTIS